MILYADDVVLAEIAACLDLDQFKKNLAEIFEAVDGAHRNINRLVLVHSLDDVIDCHSCGATHHDPVLGAMVVLLE